MERAQQRKVRELNSHYIEKHETLLEQQSKSQRGLIRRLSALALFVMIVIGVSAFTLHVNNGVLEEKLEKKMRLDEELAQLSIIERDLKDEIKNLNDLEYISEIARRDYYLTKPGEIIFKVSPTTSD